jgi:hypothetical protein
MKNKKLLIGAVSVIVVIMAIALIIIARRLPSTAEGYQAFFTAFAGFAALLTGIALALFTYQQYILRQTEHKLLYEPQMLLRSTWAPLTGELTYKDITYPYIVEWTVFILNTSQEPIIIESMALKIRQFEKENKPNTENEYLSLPSYHVLNQEGLEYTKFPVTVSTPKEVRWIIEGNSAGHDFENLFGDSDNRRFQLIFRIGATKPQDPSNTLIMEHVSNPFRVPKDAKWGDSKHILY